MKNYYLESMEFNVLNERLPNGVLSEYEGQKRFKQAFERAWTAIAFKTPREALQGARDYLGHNSAYLNEDHSRIMVIWEDEVLASFWITTDLE